MKILIPMAGLGSRVSSTTQLPKPLVPVNGIPLIAHSVETLALDGHYIFVTRKYADEKINEQLRSTLEQLSPSKKTIIEIDVLTQGPVATCLYAKEYLGDEEELIITNCDQMLRWDCEAFLKFSRAPQLDGSLLVFNSSAPQHSYVQTNDEGHATLVKEKQVISSFALTGVHYWKQSRDFLYSAERMMALNQTTKGEYYIAPSYNQLIEKGKKIGVFEIKPEDFIPLGTDHDILNYLEKR